MIVRVVEAYPLLNQAIVEVLHLGPIDINKALDVVDKSIKLPPFTDFDISCISDSVRHSVSEIYVSFAIVLRRLRIYDAC